MAQRIIKLITACLFLLMIQNIAWADDDSSTSTIQFNTTETLLGANISSNEDNEKNAGSTSVQPTINLNPDSNQVEALNQQATETFSNAEQKINIWLDALTPTEQSALDKRVEAQTKAAKSGFVLLPYRPNYVLPYYYTGSPDNAAYAGTIPSGNDDTLDNSEFKAQFSIMYPIIQKMINEKPYTLAITYTQLSYWQFYSESQWFRETDYEPEVLIAHKYNDNVLLTGGINHESNGRGGEYERSWNRAFFDAGLSGANWFFDTRVWTLIFKEQSADLHNPDIATYMGHEQFLLSYKVTSKFTASLSARNLEEIRYSAFELNLAYPIARNLKLYLQGFSGYGQSLIEYDHHTNSVGIGFALSDWI